MIEVKASEAVVGVFYDFYDYSNSSTYSPILKTLMNDHYGQIISVTPVGDEVSLEVEFGHSIHILTLPAECTLEEAVL